VLLLRAFVLGVVLLLLCHAEVREGWEGRSVVEKGWIAGAQQ